MIRVIIEKMGQGAGMLHVAGPAHVEAPGWDK